MKALTIDCFNKIINEINDIKNHQLHAIAEEISVARSHGDLRENAQYASAREKQRMINARLEELEEVVATYTIFNTKEKTFTNVAFGAKVEIEFIDDNSTKVFQILSDYEADINNGIISINAPISKAILGLNQGDETEITIAGKKKEILIKKIF